MNILAKPQLDMLLLDDLVTTSVDETSFPDEIFIYARPRDRDDRCQKCETDEHPVHGHGHVEGRFKDVNKIGRKATIVVKRQRYKCTGCGATWVQRIESLHERRMLSRRLEKHIWDSCFRSTFIDVARDHGIDEGSVRNIFNEISREKEKTHRFITPRILGIDEIHLADIPCVLTDVGERRIFDILPSRTKVNVAAYFADLPDKNRVEVIVADMWRGYHTLADEFFPGRLVVVDKFHVIRMAHNGLDDVRKAVGRTRSAEQRIQLKDERFLLAKRRGTLTEDERGRVEAWLRAFPLLRKAYNVKEQFTDAYDAPSRTEGERAIERCLQHIPLELDPYFTELTTAVSNWKDRICNYFIDPATNAYTESVNSIIRELDRVGRGYSFETMRALMLFDETIRSKRTSTRKRRPAIPDDAYGFVGMGDLLGSYDLDDEEEPQETHIDRVLKRLALEPAVAPSNEEA